MRESRSPSCWSRSSRSLTTGRSRPWGGPTGRAPPRTTAHPARPWRRARLAIRRQIAADGSSDALEIAHEARIEQLQTPVGHADISTVSVYRHQTTRDLEAAVVGQHPSCDTLTPYAQRRRRRARERAQPGAF